MEQTANEERWNVGSHALGILFGIVMLVLLLIFDTGKTYYSTFSIVLYSLCFIFLFTCSTIYHWVTGEKRKFRWRRMDHISIYFLIAGTYSPITLISLESGNGWLIFWCVWAIAAIGTLLKIFFTGRFEAVSLVLYLAMGWLIVFDMGSLMDKVSDGGFYWLIVGGILYTVGAVFYAVKKIPYNHVIWHFFVLGGAVAHFFFIFYEVI